jgi:hypothetical protein
MLSCPKTPNKAIPEKKNVHCIQMSLVVNFYVKIDSMLYMLV